MNLFNRTWISPLVTISFAVMGTTGILMFFHIKNGALVTLHEWVGWGFVIFGLVHLFLNWRSLFSYLKHWNGIVSVALGVILVAGLAVMGTTKQGHGGGGRSMVMPMVSALDVNGDGIIDANELANAGTTLKKLDRNGDGQITSDELQPNRPGYGRNRRGR